MRVCQFRHSGADEFIMMSNPLPLGKWAVKRTPPSHSVTRKKTAAAKDSVAAVQFSNRSRNSCSAYCGCAEVSRPFRVIMCKYVSGSIVSLTALARPSPQPCCTTPGCKLLGPHLRAALSPEVATL